MRNERFAQPIPDSSVGKIFKKERKDKEKLIMISENWLIRESSVIKESASRNQERLKHDPYKVVFYSSSQPKCRSLSRETNELS